MDFIKIEAFLKVVEYGSISKAAENLYLSQSTLSDRIKNLEKDLNIKLFIRKGGFKGVELTEKGKEFLKYAVRFQLLNKEIENWKNSVKDVEITILAVHSINVYLLSNFYRKYMERDDIRLNIGSHFNNTIYNGIQSYTGDIGLTSRPYNSTTTESIKLFEEKLILVYNQEYSDYNHYTDLRTLDKRDEIHLDWGVDCERWYLNYWDEKVKPKISVGTTDLLLDYLKTPKTWAIIPLCAWNYLKINTNELKTIKTETSPYRTIYLITQKNKPNSIKSKKIDDFIKELKNEIEYLSTINKVIKI